MGKSFLIALIIIAGLGAATLFVTSNPFEKKEGEVVGTLLTSIPESDQQLIREGGLGLPFGILVPKKVPQGFSIIPDSISHGVVNDMTLFRISFGNAKSDRVVVDQYNLQEYLKVTKQTIDELIDGAEAISVDEKKIYLSGIGSKTSGRFQYYQAVTFISGPVMIRIEYKGERKLSNNDLVALAASFTR